MLSISVSGEFSVGAIPVNASSSVDCRLTAPATVNGAAAVPCAGMWIHNFSVEVTRDSALDRTVAGVTPSPTTTSPILQEEIADDAVAFEGDGGVRP